MKAYVLNNGYLECDSNQMVALDTCATANDKSSSHKWIRIPVYSVLIDHPDAKIIFDTGCHPDAMTGRWPPSLTPMFPYTFNNAQRIENQLKLAGFGPKDVDVVVQSHLHADHAGNLDQFTHCDVFVHKADFEFGLRMVHQTPDPARHGAYVKSDLEVPCEFRLVEKDFELVPGVELITLPGHTPGVLGLMLHLDRDGTLIFPMDALYQRANYGPPARLSSLVYDSLQYFASIEKVRGLAAKYKAQVMFSHDMGFFETMKTAPECYE